MNDGGMNQGFALREQCGRRQRERGHGHGVLYLSMARLPVKERVFCEGNTCCEWAEIAVKHREIPFSFKFVQTRLPLDRQACAKLVGAPAAPPTGNGPACGKWRGRICTKLKRSALHVAKQMGRIFKWIG